MSQDLESQLSRLLKAASGGSRRIGGEDDLTPHNLIRGIVRQRRTTLPAPHSVTMEEFCRRAVMFAWTAAVLSILLVAGELRANSRNAHGKAYFEGSTRDVMRRSVLLLTAQ